MLASLSNIYFPPPIPQVAADLHITSIGWKLHLFSSFSQITLASAAKFSERIMLHQTL